MLRMTRLAGIVLAIAAIAGLDARAQCASGRCWRSGYGPPAAYRAESALYYPVYRLSTTAAADGSSQAAPRLLDHVNAARAAHGLPALSWDAQLLPSCQANNAALAARTARTGRWQCAHLVQTRLTFAATYQCVACSPHEADAVAQWLNSPPHRAIVLLRGATHAAIDLQGGYATLEVR